VKSARSRRSPKRARSRAPRAGRLPESYALDTYGSLFALSRKAIINDDLGAFRDWGTAAGRAAAETEAGVLWSLLSQSSGAGPVMGEDGKRLFHADHGNLAASGAAPAETTLSAARLALRSMKGLDGKTPIAAAPAFLVVGPALETAAEKLLASITPPRPAT
jgi:phage major head subunit gpT-like protein